MNTGAYSFRQRPGIRCQGDREWLGGVGARTLYIEPGSPWENGYVERFNGTLRDELLDREAFYTLLEVTVLTGQHRQTYNRIRPQVLGLPDSRRGVPWGAESRGRGL